MDFVENSIWILYSSTAKPRNPMISMYMIIKQMVQHL